MGQGWAWRSLGWSPVGAPGRDRPCGVGASRNGLSRSLLPRDANKFQRGPKEKGADGAGAGRLPRRVSRFVLLSIRFRGIFSVFFAFSAELQPNRKVVVIIYILFPFFDENVLEKEREREREDPEALSCRSCLPFRFSFWFKASFFPPSHCLESFLESCSASSLHCSAPSLFKLQPCLATPACLKKTTKRHREQQQSA